ncbi:MAG: TetR/AcrR family transcriptional regulator [Acidobacteriota bacterium]|nr:TetR/AcrR family transcriptional regulator [Acidobacteriota bacterium]
MAEVTDRSEDRPSLREDARERARARIVGGACIALARSGLDATIDEIAEEAGVSRRTVFRHFSSHSELVVAAIEASLRSIEERLPRAPEPGDDVREWLMDSMISMHELVRRIAGRAFWDIHAPHSGLAPEILSALEAVAPNRRQLTSHLAADAWAALSGSGRVPQWVEDAFEVHASGFATYATLRYSAAETGRLSGRILWEVLKAALKESSDRELTTVF